MILYNITVSVDIDICEEWVTWAKQTHIPAILATGKFVSHRLFKMLNQTPGDQGISYAIQVFCKDMSTLQSFMSQDAPLLQQELIDRFGNKAIPFHTALEEVK